jgi:hypothetical protein
MTYARVLVISFAVALGAIALVVEQRAGGQGPAPRSTTEPGLPQAAGAPGETGKLIHEEANLEGEVASLVEEYGKTKDEAERNKIKSKLSTLVDQQFDLQNKRRELQLAQLEAELKKVREQMRKRTDARQTIVERRLDQLLREADGLGWTPPPGGTRAADPRERSRR